MSSEIKEALSQCKLRPLKTTDSASFRAWRRDVELIAEENNWDDRTAIVKASLFVTGEAAKLGGRCRPQLPSKDDTSLPCPTLTSYLDALQNVFIPDSSKKDAKQKLKFAMQHPDEHPKDWCDRIYDIYCDANPQISTHRMDKCIDLIEAFTDGLLDPQLENAADHSGQESLTATLAAVLAKREKIIRQARKLRQEHNLIHREGLGYKIKESTSQQQTDDDAIYQMTRPTQYKRRAPPSTPTKMSAGSPAKRPSLECWTCGRAGHTSRHCTSKLSRKDNKKALKGRFNNLFKKSISMLGEEVREKFLKSLDEEEDDDIEEEDLDEASLQAMSEKPESSSAAQDSDSSEN